MKPIWLWLDFDGVVARRTASRSQLVGTALGLDPAICRAAYLDQLQSNPRWKQRSLGVRTIDAEKALYFDVFSELVTAHQLAIGESAIRDLVNDFIMTNRFVVNPSFPEFAEAMRGVVYLGLLSNAYPTRRVVELPELDVEFDFDDIILSSEVGLEKPEPEIFQLAIKHSGQPAADNWLVDDLVSNLKPAAAAGFGRTIVFGHDDWPEHVSDMAQLQALILKLTTA